MIQKDYIMRMIEQMTKMLAKVLLLENEGKPDEAIEVLEDSCSKTIGMEPSLLEKLPVTNIADLLGAGREGSTGCMKCLVAGKLFTRKADILLQNNPEQAIELYHKALELYLRGFSDIDYSEMDLSSYRDDIEKIENEIRGKMTGEVISQLSEYYERNGNHEKTQEYHKYLL